MEGIDSWEWPSYKESLHSKESFETIEINEGSVVYICVYMYMCSIHLKLDIQWFDICTHPNQTNEHASDLTATFFWLWEDLLS